MNQTNVLLRIIFIYIIQCYSISQKYIPVQCYIFQLYIDIPLYTKVPSLSRINILVQKLRRSMHAKQENINVEVSRKHLLPQDMETFSRSFYFTISNDRGLIVDLEPPGKTCLKLWQKLYYKNCTPFKSSFSCCMMLSNLYFLLRMQKIVLVQR